MAPPSDRNSASNAKVPACNETNNNNDAQEQESLGTQEEPSIWSQQYWLDLFDEQRLGRLQQCQTLGTILKQCQAMHDGTQEQLKVPTLDKASVGIRMLKYYDWRYRIPVNQEGCIPEKHSLWTCRAVALGCGAHLGKLKTCFDNQPLENILLQPKTTYESNDKQSALLDPTIPCADLQKALGECVNQKAQELERKRRK